MADPIKLAAATTRSTTGLTSAIAAGGNAISSAIDNSSNRDTHLAFGLYGTEGSGTTAGEVVEVYILYAHDGTNHERGGTSVDPVKVPVGHFVCVGSSGSSYQDVLSAFPGGFPLLPLPFKILLKSEAGGSVTFTPTIKTFNREVGT